MRQRMGAKNFFNFFNQLIFTTYHKPLAVFKSPIKKNVDSFKSIVGQFSRPPELDDMLRLYCTSSLTVRMCLACPSHPHWY